MAVTAAACALLAGCAGLRCPRIDPTGEQCFIWPKDQVVTPVAAVPGVMVPPVAGNLEAPPVGTDPFFPQVTPPAAAPFAGLAPTAAPLVTPASVAYPQVPQDRLAVTPGRVLAPVGSEVVLKANICTTQGYTLANQKVEWMLAREGVGQFVELGGKGLVHPPLIPWFRGSKVDNYLAHGYTADGPLCIDRGTPDPTDDVNINRGDAWISVTSPNEGTSHVTAYTPAVESWDFRKAAATIYWVDVQWTFPPPAITSSGRETLTTLVTRQTDGTPLEGWIVRYQVADGSAAGAIPEVRTGPDGRASVQVAPTGGAASSQINVQLVRPANHAGSDAPELIIASGATLITWGGSQPYLPPSTTTPATPPLQTTPSAPVQQAPITPPPSLPATTGPQLELTVTGPQQATVGGQSPIRITIRNVGGSTATGVILNDEFDPGLTFPARPRSAQIERAVANIAPGGVYEEELQFDVTKAGTLCHNVTVSFAESSAAPISRQHCLTAVAAAPQREGGLRVSIDGPAQGVQNQTMTFKVTVKNTGQTALVNITIEEEYPTAVLQPQPTEPNVQVVSGRIFRTIARLDIGQQEEFTIPCLPIFATRGIAVVRGRAETDPPSGAAIAHNDEHAFEILPATSPPPAGQSTPPPAGAPLSVVVSTVAPTVNAGARSTVEVTIRNTSTQADSGIALRVYFPPNVTPDPLAVEGPRTIPAPELRGEQLVFAPLASLASGEIVRYIIPISPTESGIVPITAQAVSDNARQPVSHSIDLEILGNRR